MTQASTLYDRDFYSWLTENSRLLQDGKLQEIDALHIAEELEALGKSERRALMSRLTVLLAHLLKWQFQPARRSRSWRNTLRVQRLDIMDLLNDSPSLAHEMTRRMDSAYRKAALLAEEETGIEQQAFPSTCPYTLEQMLDEAFFPDGDG